ncbi:gamma-glutamyl-gamma-aminobutyrate hydrolase family protein [Kitasatospora sp. NPDC052896]|uniref:gamma-glutamyl-gamma-aminobutyrate hydrolase family protein n=1 Tax=Kitasatospora sp. NPDC052896 TaxID=3364061 RepID=UPI0037CAA839
MTAGPLVGITSYLDEAAWGVWRQPAALVPQSYVAAVEAAGGVPVLLPPQTTVNGGLLERLDGLLLAGGADIAPDRYGASPHPSNDAPQRKRDAWEFELLRGALDRDLPLLGVCRGMQVLNVALGGDLVQHLPDLLGEGRTHRAGRAQYLDQRVSVRAGTRLAGILGTTAEVRCYHHQAIGRLGTGLRPAARAGDGTVEAVELPDARFVLGVQWHPEADSADPRLFEAFVTAARAAAVKEPVQ